MSSVLGALYFILFLLCITLNKTPFNLAHITENVTKFICRNVIGPTPNRINWIDFCIYLQINMLDSLIDKNLRYIILPTISFSPIEQAKGINKRKK